MTVKQLMEILSNYNPDSEVKVHCGPLQEEIDVLSVEEVDGEVIIY